MKGLPVRYIQGHCRKRWPERTLAERFWLKVKKTPTCWLWTGARVKGYGRIAVFENGQRRSRLATRVAYFLQHGHYPSGEMLHACDNPPCVRLDDSHVHEGTHRDNMQEAYDRALVTKGERHHWARFSDAEVASIRAEYSRGTTTFEAIAKKHGTTSGYICNVIHRKIRR